MAFTVMELIARLKTDTSDFDKSLKTSETKAKGFGSTMTKIGKAVAVGFAAAIVAGTVKVSKELVSAASTAEEVRNKFNVVFSDISDDAQAAATNLADNFGLSTTAAEDLLAGTADLLTGFGFTQDAALGLSDQVNQLAADLGSFQNVDTVVASEAITKALLGERESIKQLGISILDADVKARVLINSQQGMTFESERQAKAYATLQLATEQSTNAVGDYSRSQDSFANKSREAKAAIDDLKVALGTGLLPAATEMVTVFGELTQKLSDYIVEAVAVNATLKDLEDGSLDSVTSIDTLNDSLARLNAEKAAGSALGYRRGLDEEIQKLEGLIAAYGVQDGWLSNITESKAAAQRATIDLALAEEAAAEQKTEREAEAAEAELVRLEELEIEKARILEAGIEYTDQLKEEEKARNQSALDIELQNAMDHNAQILADKQAMVEAEILLDQQRLDAANSLFGGLSSLLGQAGKENKAAFIASKVFAAAQAGINSALAFTKTLADGGPFPLNTINAAGILAAGVAQQIQIAATPAPSFETGGFIPGSSFSGDNVQANVNSGEAVLNASQQKRFMDIANGGASGQTINVYLGTKKIASEVVSTINSGAGGTLDSRIIK